MAHNLDRRASKILGEVDGLPDGLLLTTQQLAELAGTSKSFWEVLRVNGGGPKFLKLGAAVRYRSADLKAWLASRVQERTKRERRRHELVEGQSA